MVRMYYFTMVYPNLHTYVIIYYNLYTYIITYIHIIYRIRQNSRGGKLSWFLLNHESFPIEYFTRLGIHYYKKLLPRKFSRRFFSFALTAKVFPLDCFDVYGIITKMKFVLNILYIDRLVLNFHSCSQIL